jgi:transcriptional regulator with XRE-family HTH domain
MTNKRFQSNMKRLRDGLGFSFEDLSKKMAAAGIKVTASTLQRYESGDIKNVPYDALIALADIFGCHPGKLMGWEPTEPDPEETILAREICGNPDLKTLFDTVKKWPPADIQFLIGIAKRMK